MLNELKQKIREVVGEGKLYEAHISYGELSYIFTKEKDFEEADKLVEKLEKYTASGAMSLTGMIHRL